MPNEELASTVHDFYVTASGNRITWQGPGGKDFHDLPDCFGEVVGITTRPRPDHTMLIFMRRAVYAMDYAGGPMTFVFTPLICE